MESWQIVLILLASIGVGAVVGALLSYLILRFVKRREPTFLSDLAALLVKKPSAQKRQTTATVEKQLKPPLPELLAEVENNCKVANEPWNGELLSFQTDVWDANRYEVHKLPANIQKQLTEAYIDIHAADNIVWISRALGHRSDNLDKNYVQLCSNIATRLDGLMPLLKWVDK